MNRAHFDHRLARLGEPLVVPAVPPVATQPGEGPLHHPTPGQPHEPHGTLGTTHHLDPRAGLGLHHPAVEVVIAVLPVSPHQFQLTAVFGGQLAQDLGGAVAPSSAEATVTTTTSITRSDRRREMKSHPWGFTN